MVIVELLVVLWMDCRVLGATGEIWRRGLGAGGVNGYGGGGDSGIGQIGEGFSNESEHDLAILVSEFMENDSNGGDSRGSSDSDSGFSDLSDKISYLKMTRDLYELETHSVVKSHILSIVEKDLQLVNSDSCNVSCIRFNLVMLLRLSGYDAGLCSSKWEGSSKVPGGDHEYIDVVYYNHDGSPERLIIDIDFHSHFEIARAVESYNIILRSLPAVYVGSVTKLEQFLQVMVEATKSSLKQNSMPFPPWRSLAYLQAKWQSPYQRKFSLDKTNGKSDHKQCYGHLKRLQSSLRLEFGIERRLKPVKTGNSRVMFDKRGSSFFQKL